MLALLAMLAIAPWNGADLPTATASAAKYQLTIAGRPGERVHLTARDVKPGWIAAFCDARVCSPTQVTTIVPKTGHVVVQFELIREVDDAVHTTSAVIVANDGSVVRVPAASR